jgi:hypothetical protein
VDVTVTAPAPLVDDVCARVRMAAALHGPATHAGLGHDGRHMSAHTHGLRLTELEPLTASAVDVDGGARPHLAAAPAARNELRAKIRERADAVSRAACE